MQHVDGTLAPGLPFLARSSAIWIWPSKSDGSPLRTSASTATWVLLPRWRRDEGQYAHTLFQTLALPRRSPRLRPQVTCAARWVRGAELVVTQQFAPRFWCEPGGLGLLEELEHRCGEAMRMFYLGEVAGVGKRHKPAPGHSLLCAAAVPSRDDRVTLAPKQQRRHT